MAIVKHLLQFHAPKAGEPLCSGPEVTLTLGQRIDLAHFHTIVTVQLERPRVWMFAASLRPALNCTVTISGKVYESRTFPIVADDLGKTLFCAGFPCLSLTGLEASDNAVMVVLSEIVDPCEPNTCPWGND